MMSELKLDGKPKVFWEPLIYVAATAICKGLYLLLRDVVTNKLGVKKTNMILADDKEPESLNKPIIENKGGNTVWSNNRSLL